MGNSTWCSLSSGLRRTFFSAGVNSIRTRNNRAVNTMLMVTLISAKDRAFEALEIHCYLHIVV
jgi:hypothetical protein